MIEFELDIPILTEERIQMGGNEFSNVRELVCSSMIYELLITEMLYLSIDSFDRGVRSYQRKMNMISSSVLTLVTYFY